VARHHSPTAVTRNGTARPSCAGRRSLKLRPFSFPQNRPSFRDLILRLLLRRKGLRNPSLFTVCSRAARQSPPRGRPRWAAACARPGGEALSPEAQHVAQLMLTPLTMELRERCSRARRAG
jgi:hypothetical protein